MTQIIIDKNKYVLLPEKEYEVLQLKAALKNKPAKKLFLADGRAVLTNSLINRQKESKNPLIMVH